MLFKSFGMFTVGKIVLLCSNKLALKQHYFGTAGPDGGIGWLILLTMQKGPIFKFKGFLQ
jgi:hypothetical protein